MKQLFPGFLAAVIVAIISEILSWWLATLGAATIAILLGILLGNTCVKHPIFQDGTKLAESKLLEFSVVLLGATVTFQTIAHIGLAGIAFILLQMSLTIIGVYYIGKKMQFSTSMVLLMAGGNAICGSSAIASVAPAVHATEEEKGQIITLVNLLGTVLMLVLPVVALFFYGDHSLAKSAFLGGTLQSVGQVVASASMLGPEIVEFAMLFKIMRIMLLVVVVYLFSQWQQKNGPATSGQQSTSMPKKKQGLPWYVAGFVFVCLVNSLIALPVSVSATAHYFSHWFEITALAAIGLRLDFQKFFKEGKRFLLYGFAVGLLQISLALIFIYFLLL